MLVTRIRSSFLICVVCLMAVVFAFSAQEVEIFKLQNEIAKRYGETIDFYKLLKITNKATSREITKNLRKLSKKYHPDKNLKYRKLYERLNLATQILADDTRRKTYDYYLKNGFPDYDFSKGGFFFNRVQPKTWIILSFVYVAISVIHYIILRLQYKSDVRRIQFFINQCKDQDDTSGFGEKRLSFKRHEEDEDKELIVRFGDVYIVEEDGKTETLISPDTVIVPTIFDSAFFKLPSWFCNKTIGKFFNKSSQKHGKKLDTNKVN